MKRKVTGYLGWYGVLSILLAYSLVNLNVLNVKSFGYQLLNLSGALGIVIEAGVKRDRQPVVLNGIWASIALIALIKLLLT